MSFRGVSGSSGVNTVCPGVEPGSSVEGMSGVLARSGYGSSSDIDGRDGMAEFRREGLEDRAVTVGEMRLGEPLLSRLVTAVLLSDGAVDWRFAESL